MPKVLASRQSVLGVAVVGCLALAPQAHAGQIDLTLFLGRAYPIYDERLTLRPSAPSLPGVDINVTGEPIIRADGGAVLGGALAFELGVIGVEARVDGTDVGFEFSGARYDLRATQAPFTGLNGSVTLGNGRFDARRLYLLSGNVRLRTPGPIGLVASGGLSLLPDVTITGSVPVGLDIAALPCCRVLRRGYCCGLPRASPSTASASTAALACAWEAIASRYWWRSAASTSANTICASRSRVLPISRPGSSKPPTRSVFGRSS